MALTVTLMRQNFYFILLREERSRAPTFKVNGSLSIICILRMNLPLTCMSGDCEIRAVIHFLFAEQCSSAEIVLTSRMCVYGRDVMPDHTVCLWVTKLHLVARTFMTRAEAVDRSFCKITRAISPK